MTPDEEYARYADPANQAPQDGPVGRRASDDDWQIARQIECPVCPAYAGQRCISDDQFILKVPHAERVTAAKTDPLLAEMAKRCADCGHAQALHCDHTGGHADDPCGCISHPDTPPEDRCRCTTFVDPADRKQEAPAQRHTTWAAMRAKRQPDEKRLAELRDYYENTDQSESLRDAIFEPGSDPEAKP